MKKLIPWAGWMMTIVVIQCQLGPLLEINHVKPDFFLLSVLFVAMRRGGMEAFVWGAAAGAFQDALSGGIVGFNLITKPMVGISVALVREKLDFNNPNTQTVVTLVAAAAEGLLLAVLLNAYQPSKDLLWSIPSIVIPGAVYNCLIIPFVLLAEGSLRTSLAQLKHRPARLTEQ